MVQSVQTALDSSTVFQSQKSGDFILGSASLQIFGVLSQSNVLRMAGDGGFQYMDRALDVVLIGDEMWMGGKLLRFRQEDGKKLAACLSGAQFSQIGHGVHTRQVIVFR